MVQNCTNPLVGIATVISGVILGMGVLVLVFPDALLAMTRLSGYLVILGIVLGFFQYSLQKEAMDKEEKAKAALARKRR